MSNGHYHHHQGQAGPMLQHSRFYGLSPLFTTLSLSPCRVQTNAECTPLSQWFASMTVWVSRQDASSDSVTLK